MVNPGVAALDDGGGIDFARLRRERRDRVSAVMAEHDFDVLILGREANARYATGARRLWLAGTRPFSPGCVLVRADESVYLLSNWDEGIPAEIPRDHLYGLSWNPMHLVERLRAMPGVAQARRIGVDSITPLWRQLLAAVAPEAALLDAQAPLLRTRMIKTDDEMSCIRAAVAIAEASLLAARDTLRPGVREKQLLGAFNRRMTDFGVTTPATEGTFCSLEPTPSGSVARLRRLASDRAINQDNLVACSGGVLYAGYEGSVGRTWRCVGPGSSASTRAGTAALNEWRAMCQRVAGACQPGSTGVDLRTAYEGSGAPLPPFPIAYSAGIGYEAPIAGSPLGADFDRRWRLEAGMVLALQLCATVAGASYFALETVAVTPTGPRLLTSLGHGPGPADEGESAPLAV